MARMIALVLILACTGFTAQASGKLVHPPYEDPKAVVEFFFDDPRHIHSALHWVRSFMNPLMERPYDLAPEFMDIVVVIHGTEIVSLAEKNYGRYKDAVERMRYYAALGVKFRVCGLAMGDYGYTANDLHDFVEIVPSAMTELVYWQQQGYGLLQPTILQNQNNNQ